MKLRRIGWMENVAWIAVLRMFSELQSENLKGRDNLRNLRADVKTVIILLLQKKRVRAWAEFIWFRIDAVEDCRDKAMNPQIL
jgi:hypothetical protein